MYNDVFQQCREAVTARAAAEAYGFKPNRSGFICCPFHHEKTPSLKLYDGNRGFYCFGCHKGGSVIDLVAGLFDLSPLEAVKRLDVDFNLGLDFGQQSAEAKAYYAFTKWRAEALELLEKTRWQLAIFGDTNTMHAVDAARDILLTGSLEKQLWLYRNRKEVEKLCTSLSAPRKN